MSDKIKSMYVPRILPPESKPITAEPNYRHDKSQMEPGPIPTEYKWTQNLLTNNANGSDTEYDLESDPSDPVNMLMVFVNGVLQRYRIDYTVSGKTIIFSETLRTGSNVVVIYNYL